MSRNTLFNRIESAVGGRRLLAAALCGWLALTAAAAEAAAEVRAVWVRPFINADAETRKDPVKGRAAIRGEIDRIARAGLNTVYLETFWDGYTIYPSRFAPQRPLAIPSGVARRDAAGQTETWDVLQIYAEEAARRGIKVHAWLHVFHQWSTNLGGLDKSPIFARYPEWAQLDINGSPLVKSEAEGPNRDIFKVFLSPSNPKVRRFLRQIVGELAEKYPQLGGIQWDYIRYPLQYPETPFDYNPLTLEAFRQETGLDARKLAPQTTPADWRKWQDWKTRQVTEVVRELGALVRRKRPEWEISAAVFADLPENLRVKQQDWRTWARENTVDALLPMLYSPRYERVEIWAKDFKKELAGTKTRVYPAFFIGHFYRADSKTFDARYPETAARLGFDGFGLFAAQSLTDDLIDRLAPKKP